MNPDVMDGVEEVETEFDDGLSDIDRAFAAALDQHSKEAEPGAVENDGRDDKGRFAPKTAAAPEQAAPVDDVAKRLAEYEARIKNYEPLESVLGPRRQVLAATYGSEDAALKQLFALSDFAERDPAGFVQWFAQQRGIPLNQSQVQQQKAAQHADPTVAALTQQVQSLQSFIEQQQRQQVESQRAALQSEINEFAKDKGADFERIKPVMAGLFATGQAKTLEEAWEKARWADPDLRARLVAEEAQRAAAEAEQRTRQTQEKIKGAAVSVRGSPTGRSGPAKPKNLDEAFEMARSSLS